MSVLDGIILCEITQTRSVKGDRPNLLKPGKHCTRGESFLPLCIISHLNNLTTCWEDLQEQYVAASSFVERIHHSWRARRDLSHQKLCFRMKLGRLSAAGFYQSSVTVWRATGQSYASCLRWTHFWPNDSSKFQLFCICEESIMSDYYQLSR